MGFVFLCHVCLKHFSCQELCELLVISFMYSTRDSGRILMKLEFSGHFKEYFMRFRLVGAELFHAKGRTDRDRCT